ncbi:MAG: GPW/gp25 family protein [Chloroflexota bacterium]
MDSEMRNREFLGQGWTFPLRVNARSNIALAKGDLSIEQAIRAILETRLGERVMRPEFGCRIHELIFDPRDSTTAGLAMVYVEDALAQWEPRIEVIEVSVNYHPEQDSALLIEIFYVIKSTHDERSIVFPFYLADEETF